MIAKFGPLSKSDCCAGMSGLADRFITHFLLELLVVSMLLLLLETGAGGEFVVVVVLIVVVIVVVVDCPLMLLLKFVRTILLVSLFLHGRHLLLVCWL